MEEVLHFNVTETPSSKIENGSAPSTPTDLQEIHFWQGYSSELAVCMPAYLTCVNTVINDWNCLSRRFPFFLRVPCLRPCCFSRQTCELMSCGFLKRLHRQLELTSLSKECVHLHRANGISVRRRVKGILQEKANITNPLAWARNKNKSVLYL